MASATSGRPRRGRGRGLFAIVIIDFEGDGVRSPAVGRALPLHMDDLTPTMVRERKHSATSSAEGGIRSPASSCACVSCPTTASTYARKSVREFITCREASLNSVEQLLYTRRTSSKLTNRHSTPCTKARARASQPIAAVAASGCKGRAAVEVRTSATRPLFLE